MAYLSIFSGEVCPKGISDTIELMEYKYKGENGRKYCYIIRCENLERIFNNLDITLEKASRFFNSLWNRRHPVVDEEFGVEICQSYNGNGKPHCIVYKKHWKRGNAESQRGIFGGTLTPEQAINLDKQLRENDVGT